MKTLKPIFSILLSLIPFCAAVSCRAQAVSDVLENDLLENAVRLSPRALEYVHDGFESSVYVWRDSLAIVLNTADGKECMDILEVFRIQDWSILGTALPYGSGAGEFFYMQSALGGDSLILFDIVKKQFVVLEPDARRKDWLEDIRPTAAVSYVAQAFTGYDDRILMLNPRYFEDSSGHSNRQPRLAVTDTSWQWTVPETEYFSTNVTQGSLAADAERGRVFFFDGNSSMAELYDGDLSRPVRIMTGPDFSAPEYVFVPGNEGVVSVYRKADPAARYTCAASDGSQVLAAYRHVDSPDYDYIFRFDWDGNLLGTYRLDCRVRTLSLSADGKSVYVWADTGGDRAAARLYRYDLL